MELRNNYLIQAADAQRRFLRYDPDALAEKLHLKKDAQWLYAVMLHSRYRVSLATGAVFRQEGESWCPAGYREIMTLLDLLCDSSPERRTTFRWRNLRDFGHQFHRSLLEDAPDPWAQRFQADPEGFRRGCEALGGRELPQGDIAYAIELFDGLCMVVQLWFGDEEFPANLLLLWDENALQYLKYETMYFAKDLLLEKIAEQMKS